MDDTQALVYDFCVQITLNHQVSDALWQKAMDHLGEQQVIDLIVVSGTYTMVSMLLNATQVGIPNQGREPLEVMTPEAIRRQLLA
jgi:4-carboxymuconolactone decarboxylase